MNPPAHLMLSAGIFAKPHSPKVTAAAIIGGMLPDISLFLLGGISLFVLGNDPAYVFGVQYFSDAWQQAFAIDNSFVLWGLILALALWLRKDWLIALTGSVYIHLITDFLLHNDDARQQFWPLTRWKFESPFSYWDPAHYGAIITTLEQIMVAGLLILLWRRFKSAKMQAFFILLTVIEVAPHRIFNLIS
jgi:hypothetical protein